ncbi:MAG: RNA polymerase sigma factor [Pirellulaceae bacterium]|nr:RNA polymerase sigma factor [Pirellulaceae bacterium]
MPLNRPNSLAVSLSPEDTGSSEDTLAAELVDQSATDEALLMAYCQTGDLGSLETLIRRYQTELYSFLRRYLGDDSLAEDAFQLTFLQVHKKAALFDASRRFRPWLYGVATHQAIDLKRREKRRRYRSLDISTTQADLRESTHANALPDHRASIEDSLVVQEQSQQIRDALDELGEPGRSAVELVYLQGLQYRDAAEILDVPVGTVKSRVHTAIRKLADIWKRTVK